MAEVMTKKLSFADIAAMGTTSASTVIRDNSPTPAESTKKDKVPSQQQEQEQEQQIDNDKKEEQSLIGVETNTGNHVTTTIVENPTVEKSNPMKNNRPRSDSTPTPAESSQRKQHEKNKHRGGPTRNRGRPRNGNSKQNGKEKKGEFIRSFILTVPVISLTVLTLYYYHTIYVYFISFHALFLYKPFCLFVSLFLCLFVGWLVGWFDRIMEETGC